MPNPKTVQRNEKERRRLTFVVQLRGYTCDCVVKNSGWQDYELSHFGYEWGIWIHPLPICKDCGETMYSVQRKR